MRINKIPKLELYSWMLSMPFILLAFHLILFDDRLWKDINIWLISFPFFTLISFFSFYGHELYGIRFMDMNFMANGLKKNTLP